MIRLHLAHMHTSKDRGKPFFFLHADAVITPKNPPERRSKLCNRILSNRLPSYWLSQAIVLPNFEDLGAPCMTNARELPLLMPPPLSTVDKPWNGNLLVPRRWSSLFGKRFREARPS